MDGLVAVKLVAGGEFCKIKSVPYKVDGAGNEISGNANKEKAREEPELIFPEKLI
jgi:hypothetical protein